MSCCRISGSLSFNSRLTSAADPLGSPGAYSHYRKISIDGFGTVRLEIEQPDNCD
jgi:hypothetical protein